MHRAVLAPAKDGDRVALAEIQRIPIVVVCRSRAIRKFREVLNGRLLLCTIRKGSVGRQICNRNREARRPQSSSVIHSPSNEPLQCAQARGTSNSAVAPGTDVPMYRDGSRKENSVDPVEHA